MKTIIHSNSDQLRASLLTAATKDIRYYLNGVCIEASPTYTRLISTDGHRASIQGFKVENTIEKEIQFIVPFETLKMLKGKVLVALSVFFGKTRLIDNVIVPVKSSKQI